MAKLCNINDNFVGKIIYKSVIYSKVSEHSKPLLDSLSSANWNIEDEDTNITQMKTYTERIMALDKLNLLIADRF